MSTQALIDAIDAAYACAQNMYSGADAYLAEDMVAQLRQCVRLNLGCADVCEAFATLGSRRTDRMKSSSARCSTHHVAASIIDTDPAATAVQPAVNC